MGLDKEHVDRIVQGAAAVSMSPKRKGEAKKDEDWVSIEDQMAQTVGAQTLMTSSPEKTFYNQIYVRKYEPEFVRREKM